MRNIIEILIVNIDVVNIGIDIMKAEVMNRKYNLNDTDFIFLMFNIIKELKKDIIELEKYGIDEEKITYVEELCNKISYFLSDDVLICDVGGKTQEMKSAYSSLLEEIRRIIVRAKACFGSKSTFVKSLGMSEMANFSYDTLIQSTKAMIPTLTEALPQLAEFGFTLDTIVELSAKIKAFEDARLAQNQMQRSRINATIERINMSNELYEKVAMYANIAKTVFAKTDYIRYKKYLISKGSKRKATGEVEANIGQ